jgi:hypothetical protein
MNRQPHNEIYVVEAFGLRNKITQKEFCQRHSVIYSADTRNH